MKRLLLAAGQNSAPLLSLAACAGSRGSADAMGVRLTESCGRRAATFQVLKQQRSRRGLNEECNGQIFWTSTDRLRRTGSLTKALREAASSQVAQCWEQSSSVD